MRNSIKSAVSAGHGDAIIYAGALGLLLSDVILTPADSVYFSLMQKNKKKLQDGEITPKEYWTREAVLYYGLNPIWWGLVLSALYFTKGHYTNKIRVGLGIVAAGAVIGVLNKNIEKDIQGI